MLRRDLKPAVSPRHRPILGHHPPFLPTQDLAQIPRALAMRIDRTAGRQGEPPIEGRQKLLLQELIGRRQVADPRQPQLLDQTILKQTVWSRSCGWRGSAT